MPSPKPEDVKLPDGYFIEALVASDYEETLELLGNIFSTNNPAAVALGIPAEVCVKCSRIDLPPEKICNGLSLGKTHFSSRVTLVTQIPIFQGRGGQK